MFTFPVTSGFVTTYADLVTARAFLGLVEGPLVPSIFILLSCFYTRKELSFRYVAGLLFWRQPSLHWLFRIAIFLSSSTVRCEVPIQMFFPLSSSLSCLVPFLGYSLPQSRTWMALAEDQDGPGSSFLYVLEYFSIVAIFNHSHRKDCSRFSSALLVSSSCLLHHAISNF